MCKFKSIVTILISLIFVMPILSMPVLADGTWFRPENDYSAWSTVQEKSQYGIINYYNGTEKLLISVGLAADQIESSEKLAWIFPVASDPEEVNLRIMSVVPRIDGDNVGKIFMQKLRDSQWWPYLVYGSQLYTLPYLFSVISMGGAGGMNYSPYVFDKIQMYGLSAEVLQPTSLEILNQYVNDKGLELPSSLNESLEYYIQEEYSLVLAYIFDISGFVNNSMKVNISGELQYLLGICAEFPTEKIYFPLKMTSAYGNDQIPITIQIIDYVTPPSNPGLAAGISLNTNFLKEYNYGPHDPFHAEPQYSNESILDLYYFFEDRLYPDFPEHVEDGFLIRVEYTQVDIRGPASGLTQDLWFEDSVHSTVTFYQSLGENTSAIIFLIFAFISALAGLITGLILFWGRSFETPRYRFIILGLFNFLTIIGVLFGIHLFVERKFIAFKEGDPGPSLGERRLSFTALFSAIFLVLAFISNSLVNLLAG